MKYIRQIPNRTGLPCPPVRKGAEERLRSLAAVKGSKTVYDPAKILEAQQLSRRIFQTGEITRAFTEKHAPWATCVHGAVFAFVGRP